MKDLHSVVNVTPAIGSATLSADNTPSAIDRKDYASAELVLAIGVGGITFDATNKLEFKLTHSDDDVTYINVADVDMLGVTGISSGIIKALTAAHAAAAAYRFGYIGNRRYLKLLADFSGTHGTGTPIAATWVFGNPSVAAVPNQA